MTYKEIENLLQKIVYSDNYKEYLKVFDNLNVFDKRNIIKCLISYFILDDKFISIAEKLNQLSLKKENYYDIIEYVRKYASLNKNSKPWYITLKKYDYYGSVLKKHFPAIFRNDIDISFFIMMHENEVNNIVKFINDPKNKLDSKSEHLFRYLEKNRYKVYDEYNNTSESTSKDNSNIFISMSRVSYENIIVCKSLVERLEKQLISEKFENDNSRCSWCPYKKNSFVLIDEINTISSEDRIDVLFIGMNPYKDEMKLMKPFKGKAGNNLRECIQNSKLSNAKIAIFNTVPCFIPDNQDPVKEVVSTCGVYMLTKVIKEINPKSLIFLGDVALQGLYYYLDSIGYQKKEELIKNIKHSVIKTETNKVLSSTYHPSYLNYNHTDKAKQTIINTFNLVAGEIGIVQKSSLPVQSHNNSTISIVNNKLKFIREVVDQGYIFSNVSFLDVYTENQNQYREKRLIVRFRKKDNKKQFFLLDVTDMIDFSYYELRSKKVEEYIPLVPFNSVIEKSVPMNNYLNSTKIRNSIKQSNFLYESDIDELDYFLIKYGEITNFEEMDPKVLEICYTDIEIAISDNVFDKNSSNYEVLVVTNIIDNVIHIHLCKEAFSMYNKDKIDYQKVCENAANKVINENLKQFNNDLYSGKLSYKIDIWNTEEELLSNVAREWSSCDIITGWNVYFDVNYIASRMRTLKCDVFDLSKITTDIEMYSKYSRVNKKYNHHLSGRYGTFFFPACYAIDLLQLYKSVERVESYSLAYVSELLLGVSKVKIEKNMIDQVKISPETFVEYNIQDVLLTKIISDKKGLILPILGQSCVSFSCIINVANTTLKPIDSLIIKTARKNGLVVRSSKPYPDNFQKLGGYVRESNKSLRNNVICLDVTSMYPNLIITYNVSFDTYIAHIDGQLVENEMKILEYVDTISEYMNCMKNNNLNLIDMNKDKVVNVTIDPLTKCIKKEMTLLDIAKFVYDNNYIITPRGTIFDDKQDGLAVVLMKELLDKRLVYKRKFSETKSEIDELFSQSYKILANAYYGAHGNVAFRFFSVYLAETITFLGQMVIRISQCCSEDYINSEVQNVH